MDRIAEIKKQVHSDLLIEKYEETNVRNSTNAYSHALGATLPYLELYRIGAISRKKAINQEYFSVQEIKDLLFLDCETLQLEIKESSLEEEIKDNEHKIALFVKIWPNEKIADYHFWRFDKGIWTEKWRTRRMSQIQDFERDKLDYSYWSFVEIYKISK